MNMVWIKCEQIVNIYVDVFLLYGIIFIRGGVFYGIQRIRQKNQRNYL